ncbi:hypothetical protein FLSI110296_01125 [Flavobacterium sinopsychrotolerans]|uniref:Uncharacterized protein n=1 Tax=Flavobacterium sinopsychrotolerans TaxID=604089 RepID=A0A1H8I8I3_9FLAO|nr:hypothetical protein SAMN04487942_0469 [Flavobacterium sinopsychrotolerans]
MNIKKYICAIDYILLQLDLIASKKGLLNIRKDFTEIHFEKRSILRINCFT